MKKTLLSLALLAGTTLFAAQGPLSKNASGTTTASVYFPAWPAGFTITAYDVTCDNATNRLLYYPGTTQADVLKAVASSSTTLLLSTNGYTTNDVLLLQNSSEAVVGATVTIRSQATNAVINLQAPLGTNLAVGDTLYEILPSAYTLIANAGASATAYLVDNLTGIAGSDVMVLQRAGERPLVKDTVSSVATNTRSFVTLKTPVRQNVTIADAVYEQLTNKVVSLASSGGAVTNRITISTTNGAAVNAKIVHETALGALTVYTITNFSGTTNLLVTPLVVEDVAVDDYVWIVHPTSYTAILPATVGDASLVLSAATALASNDVVVVNPTGQSAWRANLSATPANTNIYTLTMGTGFGVAALSAADKIYKATNTFTTILAASSTDYSVTTDASTALAANDRLLVVPASGGVFGNYVASVTTNVMTTLTFSGQIGQAMAVGDRVWLRGSPVSSVIGNATARLSGQLYSPGRGLPIQVMVTGASACTINNVTAVYP